MVERIVVDVDTLRQFYEQNEDQIKPLIQKVLEIKELVINSLNNIDVVTALTLIFCTSLILFLSAKTIQFFLRGFSLFLFVLTMASFSLLILALIRKHILDLVGSQIFSN